MWALIGQQFGDARQPDVKAAVLDYITEVLDRPWPVESTKELAWDEVSTVIDHLERRPPPDPDLSQQEGSDDGAEPDQR
jgi:hypothetical protein